MRVDLGSKQAVALYRYLDELLDKWPGAAADWTDEQRQVAGAFLHLESALHRDNLLPTGPRSSNE